MKTTRRPPRTLAVEPQAPPAVTPEPHAAATQPVRVTQPATGDTPTNGKILALDQLAERLEGLRAGKTIVHCHGVFDLLHIGHIRHLEEARAMGDLLVVTLTPDPYVNKGPNRPAFTHRLRAEALASLSCVDFVAVNHWPQAVETIRLLRPNIYVKGPDYRDRAKDHTNGINLEEQAVASVGGRLAITDGVTFSSSTLINQHLSVLPDETRDYLANFKCRFGADRVAQTLNAASRLNVLVVGDAIIDEYQYCQAIGKSSKEPVLAVKQLNYEKFAGGIFAVANHVAAFTDKVKLVTVLGAQAPQTEFIKQRLNPAINANFLMRPDAPTTVKRRFIDSYFFQKLFEVYQLNDAPAGPQDEDALCQTIARLAPAADAVVVVDFGHGTITDKAVAALCVYSRFLAVNAQSNAGNLGYHAISKYPRADLVCVAENEMRLEARDRHGDLRPIVEEVARRLSCPGVIVTRGSNGSLCYAKDQGFAQVPAVAGQVKDRMGAGDTFMAVAALCVRLGAPMEVVGLIGNAAGAEAVATVGHRRSLDRVGLIKHVECLLK